MKKLIAVVAGLAALVAVVWGAQALANTSKSTSLAARVKLLETRVAALKKRVEKVEVKQACVHSYYGAALWGDGSTYGYNYKDSVRGQILKPALGAAPSYAPTQGYRFALVDKSCLWTVGSP